MMGDYGVGEIKRISAYFSREQVYNVYCQLPGVPAGGNDNYRKQIVEYLIDHFKLTPYADAPHDHAPFVFIIDEINRGEINKIFGELFYAIDPGYRGPKGEIATQYQSMHPQEPLFYVPENVYIIGTMNDIDRSVDTFDFAMRRRFRFINITPEARMDDVLDTLGDNAAEAKRRLINLNQKICEHPDLGENYEVGPSYFKVLDQIGFDDLWDNYLEPLLKDYLQGSLSPKASLDQFRTAYNLGSDANDTQ